MTVHARDWFEAQPIGKAAEWLWNRGYQFDYVSDHQLAAARVIQGAVVVPGGSYRVVVVPKCQYMPVQTFRKLMALVKAGATVIFQDQLPKSPSGFGELADRQMEFKSLLARADLLTRSAKRPSDRILVGGLEPLLKSAEVPRETLFDRPGLMCVRRQLKDGSFYFIANRGEKPVDGFVPIANRMRSAAIFDPLTGRTGTASTRVNGTDGGEVRLQLAPGQSVVLRVFANRWVKTPAWSYREAAGAPIALTGTWQVKFLQGGPELPAPFETATLASWTQSSDTNAQNFAGTALYALEFDAPADGAEDSWLDLGDVRQSARVRLNGRDLGTLFTPPFRVVADKLRPKDNVLEVEVTNVSANRIRDLDRRGVVWRNFRDINFVNLNYRPFDASNWPLTDSGLIGPVTLTPVRTAAK
jgi:alpha-L-rhamnosidase